MNLSEIGMVASDTTRSRAYLQALVRNNLVPAYVLLIESPSEKYFPGKLDKFQSSIELDPSQETDELWSEAQFDPTLPIKEQLEVFNISYEISIGKDINDPVVVEAIRKSSVSVFIYSGAGGVLLRKEVLNTGKHFLHVHGGYLPDYKGSTTNYYSLLVEKTMGASSLFLVEQIDSGPVLLRKKFPAPANRQAIDHIFDSGARAKVLVETLQNYLRDGDWKVDFSEDSEGETYYIIHPVLKHIAVLDNSEDCNADYL